MGLNHIADAQGINVETGTALKGAGCVFIDHFGQAIAVHGINLIIFIHWQIIQINLAIGKADAIGGF